MSKPGEHKTVQGRILEYAQDVGWTYVTRAAAEQRRGFDGTLQGRERARAATQYFREVLHAKIAELNPDHEAEYTGLVAELAALSSDIAGNRRVLEYLRNKTTFFDQKEGREKNLAIIDYDDIVRIKDEWRNVYEVAEEWETFNGRYDTREDVVFLINGIPVLVIECKNASKNEAIALGVDQIRRYHEETPESMLPAMMYIVTQAIGFSYGVTWNVTRRNLFGWKHQQLGNLEAKVKTFCSIPNVLASLHEYILFVEKEAKLQKFVLRQHQTAAVEAVVGRSLDATKTRGLVWHTQGSGKTYTMIKSADLLFRANVAKKSTVVIMIDRNELEDQMLRNLAALGLANVAHADTIKTLSKLLDKSGQDYRGIIVTTIQKFRDMPANLNDRDNIYVLIDEAHRTTGGDLGTFLMAGLPKATFVGFSGTPVDKTAYGKGTFKVFGMDDDRGYLHKYSIAESIADGTTLPLYYNLAPSEMLVPHNLMDEEFFAMAEDEGVADIEELNKILDRAINLKNFLKGKQRIEKVATYIAAHYRENVEPLGYKAFVVAVDREACAMYKSALDEVMAPGYSAVVYTGNNNDSADLKKWHLDEKSEKKIRRDFTNRETFPKILIVTEKLLTGFDAPILYAMYLDKPMRDHVLLQAIARVNRPYEDENEDTGLVKPHGFVLDFVGVFDKLEKALAFDSDEIDAVVKDISLLKDLFAHKMTNVLTPYLRLVSPRFDDKDVDNLIEHFRDKDQRQDFFKQFKEAEMVYEVISPDAFLRPYLENYASLASIFAVVRNAYGRKVYVDRAFQKKTNELVQRHVDAGELPPITEFVEIDHGAIDVIQGKQSGDATRVMNLIKAIEQAAEEESQDPFLIALADRAQVVRESYEDRQVTTAEALQELLSELQADQERKERQAASGLDAITHFVLTELEASDVPNAEGVSDRAAQAFTMHPDWRVSEAGLREVRKDLTFAVLAEIDEMEKVVDIVDHLIDVLTRDKQ